jgi:hypothetical protein
VPPRVGLAEVGVAAGNTDGITGSPVTSDQNASATARSLTSMTWRWSRPTPISSPRGGFPAAAPVGTLRHDPRGDEEVDAMAQRRWEPHGEGPPANRGRPPDPSDGATRTP